MFTDSVAVDTDSIYFRVGVATQDKSDIKRAIKSIMEDIKSKNPCNDYKYAIKGEGNFRYGVYKDYKAHRKSKPMEEDVKNAIQYGYDIILNDYGAVRAHKMEADDLVSIWAWEARLEGKTPTIVGIDKDLLQIPAWHYNFQKKLPPRYIDDDEADYNLMIQCLTGDATDNIPGIKGIGPKKAEKILKGVPMQRRYNRIKAAWRGHKAGNPDVSRRLLQMLTSWEEFDEITSKFKCEAPVSQLNVHEKQEQVDTVSEVSE